MIGVCLWPAGRARSNFTRINSTHCVCNNWRAMFCGDCDRAILVRIDISIFRSEVKLERNDFGKIKLYPGMSVYYTRSGYFSNRVKFDLARPAGQRSITLSNYAFRPRVNLFWTWHLKTKIVVAFWSKNVILGFGVWTSFVLGKAYRARKGRFGVTFEVVGVIVARNLVSSWSHSNPDGCGVLVPKCHFWLNRWWNVRCVWKPFSCIPSRCFSKNYLAFHRHNCVCPPARAAVFISETNFRNFPNRFLS